MHTSTGVCELAVILAGSVINWLSPYISKMLVRFAELWSEVPGNKLQFKSPNIYNSLFSESIFPTSCSKELNISEGDCVGLDQVALGADQEWFRLGIEYLLYILALLYIQIYKLARTHAYTQISKHTYSII